MKEEDLRKNMDLEHKNEINIEDLADIRDVDIDPAQDREKRMQSFIAQIKNPLCYRYGDYVVKISFSDDGNRTIEDCFNDFLHHL